MFTRSLAAAALVVGLIACGGSSESRTQGCEEAEAWVHLITSGTPDISEMEDLESMQRAADDITDTWDQLAASAPDDVSDAMATIDRIDSDTIRVAEQNERNEAQDTLYGWITDDCGLAPPR